MKRLRVMHLFYSHLKNRFSSQSKSHTSAKIISVSKIYGWVIPFGKAIMAISILSHQIHCDEKVYRVLYGFLFCFGDRANYPVR